MSGARAGCCKFDYTSVRRRIPEVLALMRLSRLLSNLMAAPRFPTS